MQKYTPLIAFVLLIVGTIGLLIKMRYTVGESKGSRHKIIKEKDEQQMVIAPTTVSDVVPAIILFTACLALGIAIIAKGKEGIDILGVVLTLIAVFIGMYAIGRIIAYRVILDKRIESVILKKRHFMLIQRKRIILFPEVNRVVLLTRAIEDKNGFIREKFEVYLDIHDSKRVKIGKDGKPPFLARRMSKFMDKPLRNEIVREWYRTGTAGL